MRASAIRCAACVIAGVLAAAPVAARETGKAAYNSASPPAIPANEAQPPADRPLTADETATVGNALQVDPADLADAKPAKPLRLPNLTDADQFDVSHTDKPDGSSTLVIKRPLAGEWDAKVGADLNLTATASGGDRPGNPLAAANGGRDTGAAWASVGLPNLASLDARVHPANDQGKLATTFKRSIPVGGKFAVTLQNSYSVSETFSPSAPAPSDLPLMAAPAVAATSSPPQVWGSQKAVKFDILATGTTFGAGLATASNDPLTHNTLSAEQKLYGPLHVATSVTDVGQQQEHHRQPHAALVKPSGTCRSCSAPVPPSPRPTAAQVPCGNRSTWGASAQRFCACVGAKHDGHQTRAA